MGLFLKFGGMTHSSYISINSFYYTNQTKKMSNEKMD
jgi:hypothetical protein